MHEGGRRDFQEEKESPFYASVYFVAAGIELLIESIFEYITCLSYVFGGQYLTYCSDNVTWL